MGKIFRSVVQLFVSIFLFAFFMVNCQDEDFTTDSSYRLTLSADTISFDTIFSETLTATQRIMVYNRNDKDIRIDKIYHESSLKCFQINVNGKSGDVFDNVELRAKDSMYIFVQARLNELGQDAPLYVVDSLMFLYNGNKQDVKLTTYGQDSHRLKGVTIESNTHFENDKPYLIFDTLKVAEGATLVIDPGTKLYFHNNAHMQVKGRVVANGDYAHAPILFRGDRTDYIYDNIQYDKIVGQWDGISIAKESKGNIFNGCIIRSCNTAIRIDSAEIDLDNMRVLISNSWIHNTKGVALKATNGYMYVYNSIISNALNANVLLQGGLYMFNHCSIIGLPRNSRYNSCVVLSNYELYSAKEELIPLYLANFNNCLITGTYKDEIKLVGDKEKGLYNYMFRGCLIKMGTPLAETSLDSIKQVSEDDLMSWETPLGGFFVNNIWNADPDFRMVDWENYEYDFRLDSASAAIGKADPAIYNHFTECKTDIMGVDRMNRDSSDIGAFVWRKEETLVKEN